MVGASGIAPLLSDVISVDRAKTFKPDPKCYELVTPVLGIPKHEVLFVSSNSFDVAGAKNLGFKVAWIERVAVHPRQWTRMWGSAEFYRLLRGRAEQLGYCADFRIKALTDLPSIVARLGK